MTWRFLGCSWYDFCEKHKWANWIDDNIVWHCIDKPMDIYKSIRHWFYCNWNHEHWELIKYAFTSYGWDHGFLTNLEERQLDKQIKWFTEHQIMVDEQYNRIMSSLKIAKKCLHLMNTDGDGLYHFTGSLEFEELESGNSLVKEGTLQYHYDGPYINKRNIRRFVGMHMYDHIDKWHEHDIYLLKVKHLYYRIREQYTEYWWD